MPFSVLLAVLFSLGWLMRHRELMAITASGISLYRVIMPILGMSLVIGLCMLFWTESIVPITNSYVQTIETNIFGKKKPLEIVENISACITKNLFMHIKKIDIKKAEIEGLLLEKRGRTGQLVTRIYAHNARWTDGVWSLQNGVEWKFNNEGSDIIFHEKFSRRTNNSLLSPQQISTLINIKNARIHGIGTQIDLNTMNIRRLLEYLKLFKEEGSIRRYLWVTFHMKFSLPFTSVVMALVGMSMVLQRLKGGLAMGIGISLAISFCYLICLGIGESMGKVGALPPILSAWAANILFGISSGYILSRIKQ